MDWSETFEYVTLGSGKLWCDIFHHFLTFYMKWNHFLFKGPLIQPIRADLYFDLVYFSPFSYFNWHEKGSHQGHWMKLVEKHQQRRNSIIQSQSHTCFSQYNLFYCIRCTKSDLQVGQIEHFERKEKRAFFSWYLTFVCELCWREWKTLYSAVVLRGSFTGLCSEGDFECAASKAYLRKLIELCQCCCPHQTCIQMQFKCNHFRMWARFDQRS